MIKKLLFPLFAVLCMLSYKTTEAQLFKKKKKNTEKPAEKPLEDKIKPYAEVITKEAKTD